MLQAFPSVIVVFSSKGQIILEALGLMPQKLVEKRLGVRDYITFALSSGLFFTAPGQNPTFESLRNLSVVIFDLSQLS